MSITARADTRSRLPFIPGQEGAGAVTAVGAEVKSVESRRPGCLVQIMGSYAEYAAVAADRLVKIPAGVTDQQAASRCCRA